jgi:hypothetical protein
VQPRSLATRTRGVVAREPQPVVAATRRKKEKREDKERRGGRSRRKRERTDRISPAPSKRRAHAR